MKINYMKRSALLLGAAAIATSGLMAQGTWRSLDNEYFKNPAFIPGWSGALTGTGEGVGEAWDAPFEIYQVAKNLPAGEYTLTVSAFFRYGNNDYAAANMENGANHNAYIFLGSEKAPVEGLFDASKEGRPNSMAEANAAFATGLYTNTLKINHAGGDLRVGIGATDYRQDQWCCFDNFKLVGPEGEVALVNGDFEQGIENGNGVWEMTNAKNSVKTVDINKDGGANGCYRKSNASPYNFGQLVTLPAGKYRFGVQSFFRHGCGNQSGWFVKFKGFEIVDGESAYDLHVAGTEDESLNPLLYVAEDVYGDALKPLGQDDIDGILEEGGLYKETPVMCIFDEKLDVYPDNEPKEETVAEGFHAYTDSGYENEAAALFVANPELYRNYVEFELAKETTLWLGYKKDSNAPSMYWNPFRDFTLEVLDENGATGVAEVEDVNAPVEYYNLQGVRVANPTEGIFIVKQGNKATKKVFK